MNKKIIPLLLSLLLVMGLATAYENGSYQLGDWWSVAEDIPKPAGATKQGDPKAAYSEEPIWYYRYISNLNSDPTQAVALPHARPFADLPSGFNGWWLNPNFPLGDLGFFVREDHLYLIPNESYDLVIGWRCPEDGFYEVEAHRWAEWPAGDDYSHSVYLYHDEEPIAQAKHLTDNGLRIMTKTLALKKDEFLYYRISADGLGWATQLGKMKVTRVLGIEELSTEAKAFSPLAGGKGKLNYSLSADAKVTLKVYSQVGELVKTLIADEVKPGGVMLEQTWDGRAESGEVAADGTYTIKLSAQATDPETKKEYQASSKVDVEINTQGPNDLIPIISSPRATRESLVTNRQVLPIVGVIQPLGTWPLQVKALLLEGESQEVVADGQVEITGKFKLQVPLKLGVNKLLLRVDDPLGNPGGQSQLLEISYDPAETLGLIEVENNCFSPQSTALTFKFQNSENLQATLVIANQTGPVRTVAEEIIPDGILKWDGKDDAGNYVPDGVYSYRLAIGGEPGQITGQVIVDNTKPQAPRLISPRVGANLTSEPELFWEGAEDALYFKVYLGRREDFAQEEPILTGTRSLTLENLDVGTWFWQVEAVDEAGNSQLSERGSFLIKKRDSLDLELKDLRVGPNPFAPDSNGVLEELHLTYSLNQEAEVIVQIYNLAGYEVYSSTKLWQEPGSYHFAWDGRDKKGQLVPKGPYLLVVKAQNGQNNAPALARQLIGVFY